MDSLGKRLRALREDRGLTQSELARGASISNEYVGKIEREEVNNIGTEVIEALAKVLEVHPTVILYGGTIPQTTFLAGTFVDPNNPLDVTRLIQNTEPRFPLSKDEKELLDYYRDVDHPKEKKMIKEMAKTLAGK